jgi:selenocysteine-specific elongation factor
VKHIIMGTAGHIDHGKTALIKSLTGIDCDTHKEEKARGITINLGFAHLELPSGDSIGVVDVPGHRDFVHTMVGGAGGIDFALLVIASDDGVMPQTREHLLIMDVLGVRSGLVAVTKTDLVEPDLVDLAVEEVGELTAGTFLEGCPVVPVSSVTGQGLDVLKKTIDEVAAGLEDRPTGGAFRLFIDRIFTVSGFGTVVTGSVTSGSLRAGDSTCLLPDGRQLRVRRLERHGKEVDRVRAGDRASINLVGIEREDFRRGMIVSDRPLRSTGMVDARLRLFPHARGLDLWSRVVFHLGTYEHGARIHLMDHDRLRGGQTGLVQIHLEVPCVVQYGDRFVIRSTSNDTTLGGGDVVDPAPLHHRRRTAKAIRSIAEIADGDLPELVASEVRKQFRPLGHRELADILNTSPDKVSEVISAGLPEDIVQHASGEDVYLILKREHERLRQATINSIAAYHRLHPLQETGRTSKELMGILGLAREAGSDVLLALILGKLEDEGKLKRVGRSWALAGHGLQIGPETQRRIEFVAGFLKACRMQTPLMSELVPAAQKEGIDELRLEDILRYLVRERRAYFIEGNYIHASAVDRSRKMLLGALARRPEGMTVAEFRDLVGGNRKICLLLLAIYDAEGVTKRVGDRRVLTETGRAAMEA